MQLQLFFYYNLKNINMAVSVKMEDEGALGCGGPLFSPPLYKQRYSAVVAVARRLQAKKVSPTFAVTLM